MKTTFLALTALACVATVDAQDFPIKKMSTSTWVVDYEPFWSPDGKEIVLVSSRHGGMKVHVMSTERQSRERYAAADLRAGHAPAWSPDIRFNTSRFRRLLPFENAGA